MFYHYHYFLRQTNNSSSFWGAFLGAFFAFIFGLITYIVTKRRERFVMHKNVLIKLQMILSKHLENLILLQKIIEEFKQNIELDKLSSSPLIKIELPDNIEIDLGSTDLINKFFLYRLSIDQLNFNIANVSHILMRLEDFFISHQKINSDNVELLEKIFEDFLNHLPNLRDQIITLLLLIRIHQNKLRDKNSFIYGVFKTQWEQNISSEEIAVEKKKLEEEMK